MQWCCTMLCWCSQQLQQVVGLQPHEIPWNTISHQYPHMSTPHILAYTHTHSVYLSVLSVRLFHTHTHTPINKRSVCPLFPRAPLSLSHSVCIVHIRPVLSRAAAIASSGT